MRERAFVHVAGPPGSGKTTFIEAILKSVDGPVLAARCIRDDALRQAQETAPKDHPELWRYKQAGAWDAALFAFPGNLIGSDAFFVSNLMMEYSTAVLLEGDDPVGFVDLRVFVAPPPESGVELFVWRRHPGTANHQKAAIAERYAGIQHAQMVIVNVRGAHGRKGGEQIVTNIVRLRKDEELFNDILRFRGNKLPITAVVANLADPHDPGRKKALARTRRTLGPKKW
jgi:hypothetical protein